MPAQSDLFSAGAASANTSGSRSTSESEGPPRLTLIDASGFIFRAFHALPPLSTPSGVPTNAVLGFTRMLLKLLRERRPTHLALCFDLDSRKGRLAIDPNYKANREAAPAELVTQFELIRKVAKAMHVPILEVSGWEADDVIATLVERARANHFSVEIISSDKDFMQLLSSDVTLYDPVKDRVIAVSDAIEKYGVTPSQMRDYQALIGDAADNVPKVPGIGPKTAAELLNRFQSLDVLMARLDEIDKPKIREALRSHAPQIERAKALVSFRANLPIDVTPSELVCQPIISDEVRTLFRELQFFRLLDELPSSKPPEISLRHVAHHVETHDAIEDAVTRLQRSTAWTIVPYFSGAAHSPKIHALMIAADGGDGFFFDARALGFDSLCEVVRRLLMGRSTEQTLVCYDSKAVLHILAACGVVGSWTLSDVSILAFMLGRGEASASLRSLASERLHADVSSSLEALIGGGEVDSDMPSADLSSGLAMIADTIWRLAELLIVEVKSLGLMSFVQELEYPLVGILTTMERTGVRIDRSVIHEIAAKVDAACVSLLDEVYAIAGRKFNVASPSQLAQVLYSDLQLPVLKKNRTGPSTDHEVLEKLAEGHRLPRLVIDYRNVAKLKSTYLDTLPGLAGADERIRTTFHQTVAATGRLSSTNPNLQNIPIRSELGKEVRRAFVTEDGWRLISADYSQIELRILAHIAQDDALISALNSGADVHAKTAAEIYGVPEAEVTSEQRRVAKMVNYGIAYGLSAHGLSARLGIAIGDAKSTIDRYFQRFPGIARYIDETIEKTRRDGYVESLLGRRRYLPDIKNRNRNIAMAAERAAINMPIQGTAADIVKRAMVNLNHLLIPRAGRARMLLQVHDEILLEAPIDEVAEIERLAKAAMESAAQLRVNLVVNIASGKSWADAH